MSDLENKPALDPFFQEKPNPAARTDNVILPGPVVDPAQQGNAPQPNTGLSGPAMNSPGSDTNNIEAEKQREADRRARKAAEGQPNSQPDPKLDPKPPAGFIEKPIVGPAPTTGKPEVLTPVVKDEPIVHGEGAQRFANRNAIHSERVLHGKTVTMPVRKERYEHPERRHDDH